MYEGHISYSANHFLPRRLHGSVRISRVQIGQTAMRRFQRNSVHFLPYLVLTAHCNIAHLACAEMNSDSRKVGGELKPEG